ncbi:response regulator [Aliikangiella marina]|uniref:histidine kinase n=1 Tax=Aliikangiella marina TaxID=1712262 RepID=A0A545T7H4_9GAMM|nr:ATP-binding protein [Aliikangiella marina]TQV73177.1 response regulator [Aliikangiella marina]
MTKQLKFFRNRWKLLALLVGSLSLLVIVYEIINHDLVERQKQQQIQTIIKNTQSLSQLRKAVLVDAILSPGYEPTITNHDKPLGSRLPLSDKLTVSLSNLLGNREGIHVNVLSNLNFTNSFNPAIKNSEFLQSAWEQFNSSHSARKASEYRQELVVIGSKEILKVAIPDKLTAECVTCHVLATNQNTQGLRIGDTVGLIEANIPIVIESESSVTRSLVLTSYGFLVIASLVFFLFILTQRLRSLSGPKKHEIALTQIKQSNHVEVVKQAIAGIQDAAAILVEGQWLACNEALLKLFGSPSQTLLFQHPPDALIKLFKTDGSKTQLSFNGLYREALETKPIRLTAEISKLDGEISAINVSVVVINMANTNVFQVIFSDHERDGSAQENTINDQFERFLEGLKSFSESLEIGVGIADLNGITIYENAALTELTKGEAGDDISHKANLRDYYAPWALQKIEQEVMPGLLANGEWSGDLELRSRTGKVYQTREKFFYLYKNEKPHLIVDIIINISEHKKLQKALAESRRLASAASQSKNLFLANMSHEIRTPLNAILGYTDLLQRDNSMTEDNLSIIRTVSRSGKHLLTVIDGILDMSNVRSGKLALAEVDFDLHSLLHDIVATCKADIHSDVLELALQIDDEVSQYVYGDQSKLQQVLVNLIDNAIKFTQEGKILVQVSLIEDSLESIKLKFIVSDTGSGISQRNITKIFKPFNQTAERGVQEGTGLGLAISKKIIELMGGDISVASVLGEGSEFKVELRLLKSTAQHILQQGKPTDIIGFQSEQPLPSVLLVDDVAINRDLLNRVLKPLGFPIIEAGNGRQAVEVFKSQRPAIILMDVVMPEMDGIEATKKIRSLSGGDKVLIIAVTASAMDEEVSQIIEVGANHVQKKPIDLNALLRLIATHQKLKIIYQQQTIEESQFRNEIRLLEDKFILLPDEIRSEMKKALKVGQVARLRELVIPLQQVDVDVANAFEVMIDNYQLKELKSLYNKY